MLLLTVTALLAAQTPDTTRRDTVVTLTPVVVQAARSDRDLNALPLAVTLVEARGFFGTGGRGLDEGPCGATRPAA